ncbi:hypothetical protein D0Y65_039742 [Glycine soja]|uniref:Uncharacterized protein n=1 Tax=Glycine soja TaxID=3848 RepID=A0A445GMX6_GLYSO|nr:hypothetical protein D0Y65_039742 [Glycine soja]
MGLNHPFLLTVFAILVADKWLCPRNNFPSLIPTPTLIWDPGGIEQQTQLELDHAKNLVKNRQDLNMEKVGFAALFGLECFAWFWGGEIVGRGCTFTGYYV